MLSTGILRLMVPIMPYSRENGTGNESKRLALSFILVRLTLPLNTEISSYLSSIFSMKSPSTLLSTVVMSFSNIILLRFINITTSKIP